MSFPQKTTSPISLVFFIAVSLLPLATCQTPNRTDPLEETDIIYASKVINFLQCTRLCWYQRLCQRCSFNNQGDTLLTPDEPNCLLHGSPGNGGLLEDGWSEAAASPVGLDPDSPCVNRSCDDSQLCLSLRESRSLSAACIKIRTVWLNLYCNSDTDCPEPGTGCFNHKCLCSGGLFYSYSINQCVASCTNGFHSTYVDYYGWDFHAGDAYSMMNDIPTCKDRCSNDTDCLMFSFDGICFFKSATPQQIPLAWAQVDHVVTCQKTCL